MDLARLVWWQGASAHRHEASVSELKTRVQVRLYPAPEQAALLTACCKEYIGTRNVPVQNLCGGIRPGGQHQVFHRPSAKCRQASGVARCMRVVPRTRRVMRAISATHMAAYGRVGHRDAVGRAIAAAGL